MLGLVAALHDGPALVSHQQDGLDELIVPVVQPVGDVLLQVGRHVRVALAQQGVDRAAVCARQFTGARLWACRAWRGEGGIIFGGRRYQ